VRNKEKVPGDETEFFYYVEDVKKLTTKNTVRDSNTAQTSRTLTDEESIRGLLDEGGVLESGLTPILPTHGGAGAKALVEEAARAMGESATIAKAKPPRKPEAALEVLSHRVSPKPGHHQN
jgi:hypothetical protein